MWCAKGLRLKTNVGEIKISKKHIVISGDTYWSLSRKYGVPVETIISANNNDDSNLQIGEVLNIPIQFADTNDVIKPLVKHPKNPLEGPCDSIIIHKVLKRHQDPSARNRNTCRNAWITTLHLAKHDGARWM